MDIDELRAERKALESNLFDLIAGACATFEAKTGVSVGAIDAEFIDVTQIGSDAERYQLANVNVQLERI